MAFLTGFKYPLEVNPLTGSLVTVSDEDLIQSHILSYLETEPSERVMLPDYGTPDYLFDSYQDINVIAAQISRKLTNAIPQANFRVEGIQTDAGEVQLDVYWQIGEIEQEPITLIFSQSN